VNTCSHMWSGMFISPDGGVRLCCVSREKFYNKETFIDEIDDLQSFYRSEYMNELRRTDIRKLDLCTSCHQRDKSESPSLKKMIDETYERVDITPSSDCLIEHLEISFSNMCNQQCLMCCSEFSSRWHAFDMKHKGGKFNRLPIKYRNWTSNENLEKIKRLLGSLKYLVIKGGEPLIQNEVKELLEHILEENPQMRINVVSNMQSTSQEILELISKLKNLELTISVDSTGDHYNWIRGGDFNRTMENIKSYVEMCEHLPMFGYANTLNSWSMFRLIDDIEIMEGLTRSITGNRDITPWYNILPVIGPRYASPFVLPRDVRIDFVHSFERKFGIIDSNSKTYGSLCLNHLDTITSFENELFDNLVELDVKSKEWEYEINKIRRKR